MRVQRLSLDRISTIPQNIIEKILSLLPIRDAVRTSILSTNWRYYWTSIPEIKFDDTQFEVSTNSKRYKKYKFINAIFHVLLFHSGPLLSFCLFISELNVNSEIDQIIRHLSKSNTLKSLVIMHKFDNGYKLPISVTSFQRLERLILLYCAFEPQLTINGLGTLRRMIFYYVEISAKTLQRLLINSPLLYKLTLRGCRQDFTKGYKFTFAELFECLPSIMYLDISNSYIKYLAAGGMRSKPLTTLTHLKEINVKVCFMIQDEISSLVWLIRSSPNLEKLSIMMGVKETSSVISFGDLSDYSSYNLNHLKYLEIGRFSNLPHEMEFVKLIVAKSPVLKKVQIKLNSIVSVDEELKMHRYLLPHPFPQASPSAIFIIER